MTAGLSSKHKSNGFLKIKANPNSPYLQVGPSIHPAS